MSDVKRFNLKMQVINGHTVALMEESPTGQYVYHCDIGRLVVEGCKLIAHDTGNGWHLGVEEPSGLEIAMLAWPASWPDVMSSDQLRLYGFEIV